MKIWTVGFAVFRARFAGGKRMCAEDLRRFKLTPFRR